ncbi:hypothetical protein CJU90_0923 [Yarrowia sp. C11]|nr:hypothetical protein CKK34_2336 [Yarrowia sp. E02]KAG5373237.1 hypothetical protein CJU90_0923 [Yarrowia sp. C11]
MKFSAVAVAAVASSALAAPSRLAARNEILVSGENAAQVVADFAPVFSLAPGGFAAEAQQNVGFLDFSGYINFAVGLLQTGGQFLKDTGKAITDLSLNELGQAISNALLGVLKYLNAFLAVVKGGTQFDQAVYAFIINSGLKDFLTNVGMWIVNLSQKILMSPLLNNIVDILKNLFGWLFGSKQTVQKTLGDQADTSGFDRAMLAVQSVQSAAQQKLDGQKN